MKVIRDSDDFQRQSRRTWTADPHTDLSRGWELLGDIDDVARKLDETLDEHKRALFYGDDTADVLRASTGEDYMLEQVDEEGWSLIHASLGAATEAGEILEQARKCLSEGKEVDMDNVREEIGDLLYYVARLADVSGTTLLKEMERNNKKLKERFPDDFDKEYALNRDLDAEEEIIGSSENTHEIGAGRTLGEIARMGIGAGFRVTEMEFDVKERIVDFRIKPKNGSYSGGSEFSEVLYDLGEKDRCRVAGIMADYERMPE